MTKDELLILLNKTNKLRVQNIENLIDLYEKDAFKKNPVSLLNFINGEQQLTDILVDVLHKVGKEMLNERKIND